MGYEKHDSYKMMKVNLKRAMAAEFYYQAIFIEYAIIEDRTLSAIMHAGIKYKDSRGMELKLSSKLNKLRDHPRFTGEYVRKRITLEFINEIENWKRDRDGLIHALARIPYDHESVKSIAEKGREIVNNLDNKIKSINCYFDKQNEK